MFNLSVIEDEEEIRNWLKEFFSLQEECRNTSVFSSVEDFLANINCDEPPDVLLLDINLPGMSGISGLGIIKDKFPELSVVMLSVYDDEERIFSSLCAGADGYMLKNTPLEKIKDSVDIVLKGGAPMSPKIARKVIEHFKPETSKPKDPVLTPREKEIVAGLVDGLSYKLIAGRMNISIDTVRQHIRNIYKKLHVNSKSEVIVKAFRGEI